MELFPQTDPFWWWPALRAFAVVNLLALALWPWTSRACRGFRDRGAGLAPAGGVFGWLLAMQVVWRTGLLDPHPVWAWLVLGLAALAAWGPRLKPLDHATSRPRNQPSFGTRARMRAAAARGWCVFTLLFVFWSVVRSADPAVDHTEQPMDAMWLRAAMASDGPPMRDAWFGGAPATYYVEGHQNLAFLAHLFGESAPVAVNLGQILWFALTGLLAFETAGRLACGKRFHYAAAWMGLLLVLFLSTPRGALDALRAADKHWWWWDASRAFSENGAPMITEFPFFSFWLGDNHAHLLGLPFLLLSVLAAVQLRRVRRLDACSPALGMLAAVWSWRVNPWQAPAALAVVALGLALRRRRPTLPELRSAAWGAALPLLLVFPLRPPGLDTGVALNSFGHSSPLELLRVFGFLLPGLALLAFARRLGLAKALALLGLAMLLATEVLVVRDAFQSRMNTVFKVYYQVWVLWGVAGAAGWGFALRAARPARILFLPFLLIPAVGLIYAARLSGTAWAAGERSLHAWSRLPAEEQHLLQLADRLIQPGDRIAEAPGDSYRPDHSLLGTWTAGDTLVGWQGHQLQWRTAPDFPDLSRVYRARSEAELSWALRDLEVDWVLAGPWEQQLYGMTDDWHRWMRERGFAPVITTAGRVYRVPRK